MQHNVSINSGNGVIGVGFILRDEDDRFLEAHNATVALTSNSLGAEALGGRFALSAGRVHACPHRDEQSTPSGKRPGCRNQ